MKINSKAFWVRPGEKITLREWPTIMKPLCKSKKQYHKLLGEHIEELQSLQRLHYASNRYVLLLIFQAMDATGKDGAIRVLPTSSSTYRITYSRNCWKPHEPSWDHAPIFPTVPSAHTLVRWVDENAFASIV